MGKIANWQHPQVGDNSGHFAILRHFISKVFSFWNALDNGSVVVEAECINEDPEWGTSYLITVTGTGQEPGRWSGELTVHENTGIEVWYGEDNNPTNPEHLRNVILFQMLYGYED